MNTKIDVHLTFPTPVIVRELENAAQLNEALRRSIIDRKASSKGIQRSNILGWHSDTEMLNWGGEAAQNLAMQTLQTCGEHTTDIGMQGQTPRFEMAMDMWANVSPAGASNQSHAHPGALWSAVYYVDDGGDSASGQLVLQDPRFPMNRAYVPDLVFVDGDGRKEESQFRIAPTPGKLVLFPSWMMHGVKPHQGSRERISIAMNVMALPVRPNDKAVS